MPSQWIPGYPWKAPNLLFVVFRLTAQESLWTKIKKLLKKTPKGGVGHLRAVDRQARSGIGIQRLEFKVAWSEVATTSEPERLISSARIIRLRHRICLTAELLLERRHDCYGTPTPSDDVHGQANDGKHTSIIQTAASVRH